jgi:hypothetical protein
MILVGELPGERAGQEPMEKDQRRGYSGAVSDDVVQRQYDFYLANQDDLVKKYLGRWIVITGESVVGDFPTEEDASAFASASHRDGTFVIQLVF